VSVESVRWLQSPSPEDVVTVAAMVSDFWREVLPGEPDLPAGELAALSRTADHRRVLVAVLDKGDEPVGAARLVLNDVQGCTDEAFIHFLVVGAEHRSRGIGRALLDAVVERARNDGRTKLKFDVATSHRAGMAFAEATGARQGLLAEQNRVRTDQLDRALLEAWVKAADERASGYSLLCFDDVCPDDWLDQLTLVTGVMNTAPRSDEDQDVTWTAEQLRANQEAHLRRGGWNWTVCARHDATGELVGYTELGGFVYRPWLAQQGDTGVEPSHRNRGLGRWIKAANALRLLRERPEMSVVETWNAGVNAPMLSINHAMGFGQVARWQEWVLSL